MDSGKGSLKELENRKIKNFKGSNRKTKTRVNKSILKLFMKNLKHSLNMKNGAKKSGTLLNSNKDLQRRSPKKLILSRNIKTIQKFTQYLAQKQIVFMGTVSSGKSTFINSLLGQQLLPSKNQSYWALNTNANEDTKITINGEEFNSLGMASNMLMEIQNKAQPGFVQFQQKPMEAVHIKTQSYFHKTLSKDLQDKVFFIDTPGIELSKSTPKQYLNHFGQINQLIKLDEYSIRLNMWILNYTTFGRDQELQKNMNFMTRNEAEQIRQQNIGNQQKYHLPDQNLNQASSKFFFILNKYERKDEDDSRESVLQNIKVCFNSENIFMISAENALQYNVMTFGCNQAQEKFIFNFYKNNKIFQNIEQAINTQKTIIYGLKTLILHNSDYKYHSKFKI